MASIRSLRLFMGCMICGVECAQRTGNLRAMSCRICWKVKARSVLRVWVSFLSRHAGRCAKRRGRLQIFSLGFFGFFGVFDVEIPASTRISNGASDFDTSYQPSLSLPYSISSNYQILRCFLQFGAITAGLAHHTNITLWQGLPN